MPGWEGGRFKQHLWGRRVLAVNWEGLWPKAQRKPWSWSHTNLGLRPNPAAYFKLNHEATRQSCLSPASSSLR